MPLPSGDEPMTRPEFSVCMATHNGERYLAAQLDSILNQLSPTDEVIVVDDASTDATRTIVLQFNDPRIRLVALPVRIGPTRAFEAALREARGEFVFLSDQDDLWKPGKVPRVLEVFTHTKALAVMTDATVVDASGRVLHESYFTHRNCGPGLLKNFYKTTYLGCCMAFRGECRDFLLPFPRPRLAHDVWIGFACELAGRLHFLAEQLVIYRRHGGNFSPLHRNRWDKVAWIRLTYLAALARALPRTLLWRARAARKHSPAVPQSSP